MNRDKWEMQHAARNKLYTFSATFICTQEQKMHERKLIEEDREDVSITHH